MQLKIISVGSDSDQNSKEFTLLKPTQRVTPFYDLNNPEDVEDWMRDKTEEFLEKHAPEEIMKMWHDQGLPAEDLVKYLQETGISK